MCMVYLDFSRGIFLSQTHLVPRSPTHIVPSRSRGGLSITNTPSRPPPCVDVLHVSLSTLAPRWPDLYWTCAIGVSISVANNHALAIFVYLLTSLFYLRDACMICLHKKRRHTLSLQFIICCPFLFHTHTLFHACFNCVEIAWLVLR